MKAYYAIRPTGMPDTIRIEQGSTPEQAAIMAFGRGTNRFEYCLLSTRVREIQTNSWLRKKLAEGPWIKFGA